MKGNRKKRRRRRKKTSPVKYWAAFLLLAAAAVSGIVVWNLTPGAKIAKRLKAADAFVQNRNYEEAIASCVEALEIDSKSVEAYRAMAGVYVTKEDWNSAEQILYKGWENTQDETLLQEYCVHLLNDAVADINGQNCTLETLGKCVAAMEQNPQGTDAYKLLDACYNHLFAVEETTLFCSGESDGVCGFEAYLDFMNRMLDIYAASPAQELKVEILKYAVPSNPVLWLDLKHLEDYRNLLVRAAALDDGGTLDNLTACLEKAAWAQSTFAEAFRIFESGEFEPVRDFMQSEDYISLRDQFIEGCVEYWEGKTYIPVSKDRMKLMNAEGKWSFSFADFGEYPEVSGVIKIWGTKQEDAGVQRICISYEPPCADGEYYPHTTYEFVYLYSNVKIGGQYVPQMNYRFETRIADPMGTTSWLIGDWGGEHEWTTEY
ncbi:MAG: tetratricopeptide repeat protein [Lachnospiraceae bacterium]|nr:tetratricopeptide repeat protein [Lachnospiraceae bacterium]